MSALTDLIRIIPPDRDEDPEDIFASAPGLIFTDDLRNQHGDPDSTIIYKSKRFGEIELKTTDPGVERERQLFSHYLWNAGIRLAELISDDVSQGGKWSVKGEKVLELGAGTTNLSKIDCIKDTANGFATRCWTGWNHRHPRRSGHGKPPTPQKNPPLATVKSKLTNKTAQRSPSPTTRQQPS